MTRGDKVQTPNGYEGEVETVQPDGSLVRVRLRKNPYGKRIRTPLWWAGDIEELVTLEASAMSDFKVGDVVRFKPGGQEVGSPRCGVEAKYADAPHTITDIGTLVTLDGASAWSPSRFTLVSRPSEAKPQPPALKVGDRVRVIQRPGKDSFSSWVGTIGTIFEWHEPTKTWGIRHEAGKVNGREWSGWAPDSLELLPPEPASNKGLHPDYLRQRAEERARGHDLFRREILGTWPDAKPPNQWPTWAEYGARDMTLERVEVISQCAKPTWPFSYPCALAPNHTGKCMGSAQVQEARKPDEATIKDWMQRQMRSPEKIPFPTKPMTATEASIKARNSYEPMRDPEYTHEMDAMRYMLRNLAEMAGCPPALRGKTPEPSKPDANGWMPAGTYMPLKAKPRAVKSEPGEMHFVRYKRLDAPPGYENLKRGIAKAIPVYERRFPSRTTQWANAGDDYELLEDAE